MLDEKKFIILLNRQQESGLSIQEFCSNEGIAPSSFYYWKKKLRKGQPPKGFIPLVVKSSRPVPQRYTKEHQELSLNQEQTGDDTLLEVVYPNGAIIRIKKDLDLSRLRALISLCD